jgi:hypothetical protein
MPKEGFKQMGVSMLSSAVAAGGTAQGYSMLSWREIYPG